MTWYRWLYFTGMRWLCLLIFSFLVRERERERFSTMQTKKTGELTKFSVFWRARAEQWLCTCVINLCTCHDFHLRNNSLKWPRQLINDYSCAVGKVCIQGKCPIKQVLISSLSSMNRVGVFLPPPPTPSPAPTSSWRQALRVWTIVLGHSWWARPRKTNTHQRKPGAVRDRRLAQGN